MSTIFATTLREVNNNSLVLVVYINHKWSIKKFSLG